MSKYCVEAEIKPFAILKTVNGVKRSIITRESLILNVTSIKVKNYDRAKL